MQIIPRQPNLRAALLITLLAAPLTLWALAVGWDRAAPQAPAAAEASRVERQQLIAPTVSPSASKLVVLHWDIFMTPPPVGYLDAPTCRAAAIADQIAQSGADVVTLNEAFDRVNLPVLTQALRKRYPHQVLHKPDAASRKLNGGLAILSKTPLTQVQHLVFERCHDIDCVLTRGALMASVEAGSGRSMLIATTHLNGGLGQGNREVRLAQAAQLKAWTQEAMERHRQPGLLTGVLNANGIRHSAWDMRPGRKTLNHYGELMQTLGNTCVQCEGSRQCEATCSAWPRDAVRELSGPWRFTPWGTRAVQSMSCLGPAVSWCVDLQADNLFWARQRTDYALELGAPKRDAKRRAEVKVAKHLDAASSRCGADYLSDHKPLLLELSVR